MKNKTPKNNLRELIINNPSAQERIEIREIEKQIKETDRKFTSTSFKNILL